MTGHSGPCRRYVIGEHARSLRNRVAALSVRSGVDGRASRYFLLRAWLPIVGLPIGAIVIGRLVGSP